MRAADAVCGSAPEKVLQIGEGNFLRAFADWIIECANNAGVMNTRVAVVSPRGSAAVCEGLNAQGCAFTLVTRGLEGGKTVENFDTIGCISRCINPLEDYDAFLEAGCGEELEVVISNTTEAGIEYVEGIGCDDAPHGSFPAKLCALLYARFERLSAAPDKGLLMLPTELVDNNGDKLRECVLRHAHDWGLPGDFVSWVEESCCFANTLVDRIVTGFPLEDYERLCERLGHEDPFMTVCEPFLFWAIECPERWRSRFPVADLGLNIIFADDISPYRTRKIRLLNGAHTAGALAAYLSGHDTVLDMMGDSVFESFLRTAVFDEIIPTLSLPRSLAQEFAESVFERFKNPFIAHRLLDISLNSVSKFRRRCLPPLATLCRKNGDAPRALTLALSALIRFYRAEPGEGGCFALRGGEKYQVRDSEDFCRLMHDAWSASDPVRVLKSKELWGEDISALPGLERAVRTDLEKIERLGMRGAVEELCLKF